MNPIKTVYCRAFQTAFRIALPILPYREPEILRGCGELEGIREEDIPVMAAHAAKEANPLYPVPRRMTREELADFYRQVAALPEPTVVA